MRRALVLLTHRKQMRHLGRALRRCRGAADEFLIFSLTPESRLQEAQIKSVSALGARYIDLAEIEMSRSHEELSKITTELIRSALERIAGVPELVECSTASGVSLIRTQDNSIYTYGYRRLIAVVERIWAIAEQEKPDALITFGPSRLAFRYPERPDIERLYESEMIYAYLINAVAQALQLNLRLIKSCSTTAALWKLRLRALLVRAYKFYALSRRVLRDSAYRRKAQVAEKKRRARVAIVFRGESEYWTIQSVIEMLRARGGVDVLLLQDDIIKDPSARAVLERRGEKFVPIHSYATPLELMKIFSEGVRMGRQFDRRLGAISFDSPPPASTLHASVLGSDSVYAREVLRSMSQRFPEQLLFVRELSRFIETWRPDLLVTMSMVDNWGPLICETGKQHGIKTLAIQNAARAFLSLPTMIFAHKFAVASQRQRDGLVRLGGDPDRIIVTGIPQYDPYFNKPRDPGPTRRSLSIEADEKLVLMTTQPTRHEDNVEFIKAALEALSVHPEAITIIKLHPRERLADYGALQKFVAACGYRAQFTQQRDVLELINAADLMLSRVSTTIQSALMLGTPVIAYISKANEHAQRDYLETEAVKKISSLEELPAEIERWFSGYSQQKELFSERRAGYLEETVGVADGRASQRILSLMDEMMGERLHESDSA